MDRRALGEMLSEVAEAALAAVGTGPTVRATHVEVSLPIEVRVGPGEAPVLLGDVPLFRWRTDFDAPVSRFRVVWQEAAS